VCGGICQLTKQEGGCSPHGFSETDITSGTGVNFSFMVRRAGSARKNFNAPRLVWNAAVRNGRIFEIFSEDILQPGFRLVFGYEKIKNILIRLNAVPSRN
jgi:hypothetical protein